MPTISAVVCTKNSIASIERCLTSLKHAGIHEIVVVDARSTDGTVEIATQIADKVLFDDGQGLGAARNIGIAQTSGDFVLNFGSDNIITPVALDALVQALSQGRFHGVGAQTVVPGTAYIEKAMNAWRKTRFRPGPARVIGTPSLFLGDMLRSDPFDPSRSHSDDSELCERWLDKYGSVFAIIECDVLEIGKSDLREVRQRATNYGTSDAEIFAAGVKAGWSHQRMLKSILHPLNVDFLDPMRSLSARDAISSGPFLLLFVLMRYQAWFSCAMRNHK